MTEQTTPIFTVASSLGETVTVTKVMGRQFSIYSKKITEKKNLFRINKSNQEGSDIKSY
jgi:hypothetical protein